MTKRVDSGLRQNDGGMASGFAAMTAEGAKSPLPRKRRNKKTNRERHLRAQSGIFSVFPGLNA